MNSASRTTRILTILLLVAAAALTLPGTALSQTATAQVFIDPAEITVSTCGETTLAVRVKDVANLTAYHLDIAYDAADLEILDVANGDFLGEPLNAEFYEPANSWATPGVISFGMAQQNAVDNPIQPRSGEGNLIVITLKAKAAPAETAITIDGTTSALVNWPEALPIEFTTVNGTVTTESCAPLAGDQSVTTAEDTAKPITLVASDPDSDPLAYTYSGPAHGSLSGSGASVTYTPDGNYNGADSFTFTVDDGHGQTATGTVSITVTAVDDPTIALDQAVTTNEHAARAITLGVTEVDGDALTWTFTNPSNGTLTGTAPDLTYTPTGHFYGSDSFTFFVFDGHSQSNTATVSISVTEVNDAPVPLDETLTILEEQVRFDTVSATDADGDPITYSIHTQPGHGGLVLSPNGSYAYQPAIDYYGADSFQFTATDNRGASAIGTITFNITNVNDVPVAVSDSFTTTEDTQLMVEAPGVLANDSDVDNLILSALLVEAPAHGTFSLNADGSFSFMPEAEFSGVVFFTYLASDGQANSFTVSATITVTAVNDLPVLTEITDKSVDELAPLAFSASATDVESGLLTFSLENAPEGAAITPAGAFSWTATEAQGPDDYTFTVKVCDDAVPAGCTSQEITVTVNEVNLAPVATGQVVATAEDTPLGIALSALDGDLPLNTLTWTIVTPPQHGTFSGTAPALTYTPDDNYFGPDSFTFKVNDGTVDSNTAEVTITVTPVNDLPVAQDQSVTTAFETPAAITLIATDADGDDLTWVVNPPAQGSITGTNANWLYTPEGGFTGSVSFTFKVNDGTGDSNIGTVTITVGEPPTFYIYLPVILR